jgi:hypothetical protein
MNDNELTVIRAFRTFDKEAAGSGCAIPPQFRSKLDNKANKAKRKAKKAAITKESVVGVSTEPAQEVEVERIDKSATAAALEAIESAKKAPGVRRPSGVTNAKVAEVGLLRSLFRANQRKQEQLDQIGNTFEPKTAAEKAAQGAQGAQAQAQDPYAAMQELAEHGQLLQKAIPGLNPEVVMQGQQMGVDMSPGAIKKRLGAHEMISKGKKILRDDNQNGVPDAMEASMGGNPEMGGQLAGGQPQQAAQPPMVAAAKLRMLDLTKHAIFGSLSSIVAPQEPTPSYTGAPDYSAGPVLSQRSKQSPGLLSRLLGGGSLLGPSNAVTRGISTVGSKLKQGLQSKHLRDIALGMAMGSMPGGLANPAVAASLPAMTVSSKLHTLDLTKQSLWGLRPAELAGIAGILGITGGAIGLGLKGRGKAAPAAEPKAQPPGRAAIERGMAEGRRRGLVGPGGSWMAMQQGWDPNKQTFKEWRASRSIPTLEESRARFRRGLPQLAGQKAAAVQDAKSKGEEKPTKPGVVKLESASDTPPKKAPEKKPEKESENEAEVKSEKSAQLGRLLSQHAPAAKGTALQALGLITRLGAAPMRWGGKATQWAGKKLGKKLPSLGGKITRAGESVEQAGRLGRLVGKGYRAGGRALKKGQPFFDRPSMRIAREVPIGSTGKLPPRNIFLSGGATGKEPVELLAPSLQENLGRVAEGFGLFGREGQPLRETLRQAALLYGPTALGSVIALKGLGAVTGGDEAESDDVSEYEKRWSKKESSDKSADMGSGSKPLTREYGLPVRDGLKNTNRQEVFDGLAKWSLGAKMV